MRKALALLLSCCVLAILLSSCQQPAEETTPGTTEDIYMNALHKTDPSQDGMLQGE